MTFVFILNNGKAFIGDKEVRYPDVVSGGELDNNDGSYFGW